MENFEFGKPVKSNLERFSLSDDIRNVPSRLSFSPKPTPIVYVPSFSSPKVDFFVKCDEELGFLLSGNKTRGMEYIFNELYKKSKEKKIHVISCGWLDSNHCRVMSIIARKMHFVPHIFIMNEKKNTVLQGNDFLNKIVDSDYHWITLKEYDNSRTKLMNELKVKIEKEQKNSYCEIIPEGGSTGVGLWGYVECVKEIEEQMGKGNFPDHIFVSLGSGGTLSGLLVGILLFKKKCKVWGVCSCYKAKHFYDRVKRYFGEFNALFGTTLQVPEKSSFEILDEFVGVDYGIPYIEEIKVMKKLAKEEGIIFDSIYGGKTLYGAMDCLKTNKLSVPNRKSKVMIINTGGTFELLSNHQGSYFNVNTFENPTEMREYINPIFPYKINGSNYTFLKMKKEHLPECIDILTHTFLYSTHPIYNFIEFPEKIFREEAKLWISSHMHEGLNLVVVDEKSELVGVFIMCDISDNKLNREIEEKIAKETEALKQIDDKIGMIEALHSVYEGHFEKILEKRKIKKVACIEYIGIKEQNRGGKLGVWGTILLEKVAKILGYQALTSCCSNLFPAILMEKCGFTKVGHFEYENFVYKGKTPLKGVNDHMKKLLIKRGMYDEKRLKGRQLADAHQLYFKRI